MYIISNYKNIKITGNDKSLETLSTNVTGTLQAATEFMFTEINLKSVKHIYQPYS
jgi:hypothetical protein